ncbi:hypothetical protein KR222_008149, partial [Zaprionus bogoriensis]
MPIVFNPGYIGPNPPCCDTDCTVEGECQCPECGPCPGPRAPCGGCPPPIDNGFFFRDDCKMREKPCKCDCMNPFYIGPYPERSCGSCPYGIFSGFARCGWGSRCKGLAEEAAASKADSKAESKADSK